MCQVFKIWVIWVHEICLDYKTLCGKKFSFQKFRTQDILFILVFYFLFLFTEFVPILTLVSENLSNRPLKRQPTTPTSSNIKPKFCPSVVQNDCSSAALFTSSLLTKAGHIKSADAARCPALQTGSRCSSSFQTYVCDNITNNSHQTITGNVS